ncbi:MAG: hypothetical protein WCO48_00835 [Candidatus Taylorbacteria bacterium]
MKEILKHPHTKKVINIFGVILVALVIFSAGVTIGFIKGEFSERWDKNYMGMMGGPRSPFQTFSDIDNRAPSPHGTAGQVISSGNGQIVVRGPGEMEYIVIVSPQTIIRQLRQQGTTTDVVVGSWITAIGSPDETGRLVASFIRIMPSPQK